MRHLERAYELLTSEVGEDDLAELEPSVRAHLPANFLRHVASLAATKTGDGLSDPKLVLAWLLGALGAPAVAVGLLVPVREAGALLPQLALAAPVARARRAKCIWAAGAALQGICLALMGGAVLGLRGAVAGWAIVGLLGAFALARSACSVSHKRAVGRTLARATRGTAAGLADSAAAAAVFGFGALLALGVLPLEPQTIARVLWVAGGLFAVGALLFLGLDEPLESAPQQPARGFLGQLALVREQPRLARFIAVRALLCALALAPPYFVALGGAQPGEGVAAGLGQLGPLVLASSLAGVFGGFVWGRLADRSSRRVLISCGIVGAAVLGLAALAAAVAPGALAATLALPALLFALLMAYRGVRLARATHLVDMSTDAERAAYTAVSNTVIGAVLIAAGAGAALLAEFGPHAVLGLFAAASATGAWLARGLEEVQGRA